MGNRSNINLVGNTTQGQNLGGGDACVFKGKAGGNLLQYRSISATGTSIQIYQVGDEILISGATGGGGVTPTNNLLFWNNTISAYTPYSTKTIGTFYSGTTCPAHLGCQLNYDGTFTSTCMCSCGSRSCYFGIICDGLGSTFGATTTCAYIQDYHGTVVLKSGSYGNIRVCYGFSTYPVLYVDRTYSMNNNGHKGSAILVCDNPTSIGGDGIACGGIFQANIGSTARIFMNPRMRPSGGTAYFFDTHQELTGATSTLLSVRNNASEKFAITYDGVRMCNLPTKTTETCGIYIDATGKLSTGVISGGTGGDSYWTSGATGLSPAEGEDIYLPAGDLLKWSDSSNIGSSGGNIVTCGTTVRLCAGTGYVLLNGSSYTIIGTPLTYLGGLATASWIDINTGGKLTCIHGAACWNFNICGGNSTNSSAAGTVKLLAGNNTSTGTGGNVCIQAGASTSGTAGRIMLKELPAKSSETNVVYIDATGNLSSGAVSGGLDPYAALTYGSTVSWNASTGLNKTLAATGNFILSLTNLSNGMSGDLRIVVTSGPITITLPTSKLNGSVTSIPNGVYHLSWIYDGTNLDFSIAQYV